MNTSLSMAVDQASYLFVSLGHNRPKLRIPQMAKTQSLGLGDQMRAKVTLAGGYDRLDSLRQEVVSQRLQSAAYSGQIVHLFRLKPST